MPQFRYIILAVSLSACAANAPHGAPMKPTATAPASTNPLLVKSPLLYEAPPFDRIKDADYEPAIMEGIRLHRAEIDAIANDPEAASFENTLVAMERTGRVLHRVTSIFMGLTQSNSDEKMLALREKIAPILAAHDDEIYQNPKLFARVKTIYDERGQLYVDAEAKMLITRVYQKFVRFGAQLAPADQAILRKLNQEESSLSAAFEKQLLDGTKAGALVVTDKAQLAGLSEGDLAAASEAAKHRKLAGAWVIPLQNTTQQPAQASLQVRKTRESLFEASTQRTERGDANDTRATIQRLAQLRAQKAKLLGFSSFAAYTLQDQMAKTPERALKILSDLVPASVDKAKGEAAQMQALIDKAKGGFKVQPWDWQFYAERVRKAQYDLDEEQTRPYFVLDRVLEDGVFYAANQLYGLTFKERHDLPVYQPDVRVFEVFDADGKSLGLFYADYWKRDNKAGGAWMDAFSDQSGLLGTHPVVFNVCNFTKPAPGKPALITFSDVVTMFHEFGHALHGLSSNVQYPSLAGTNVPRDFVEFPSQFNEHWATEPTVFARFAKHYESGAPMPAAMVARIKASRTYGEGYATTEYLAAALLDMAWHTLPADAERQDVDAFEKEALAKYHVDYAPIPPRYRTSYFAHIWGGGYAAGYYAYLWSAVLRDDAFYWFKEHGGMTRENGQRFRDMVLSRGNTIEMDEMYRAFRGRDPSIEPLLEERGLKQHK
jgi:peptidyl-dipeptidase Dcp